MSLQPFFNKVVLTTLVLELLLCVTQGEPFSGGGSTSISLGGGVGIHAGGGGAGIESKCPRVCTCAGQTVDCSHRGLTQVPRKIPQETERL